MAMVKRTTGSLSPRRTGGSNGGSCNNNCFLRTMKDFLLVSFFVTLVVMNYLNISLMHVLEQRAEISPSSLRNVQKPHYQARTYPPQSAVEDKQEKKVTAIINVNPKKRTIKRKPRADRPKNELIRQKKIPSSGQGQVQASEERDNQYQFLVEEGDSIYMGGKTSFSKFDSAPIVDEDHKLLFFSTPKVACTTFKFLFRRIAGVKDWDVQGGGDEKNNLPHNPQYNNLKYLWDYPIEEANEMMTDPTWTKAIFVRDPKTRFLSAFLDKAVGNYGSFVTQFCCSEATQCHADHVDQNNKNQNLPTSVIGAIQKCQVESWDSRRNQILPKWLEDQPCCKEFKECQETIMTVEGFLETIQDCENGHWDLQSHRMEDKYWKHINFVGKMETINEDTEKLLKKVGAWDDYGKTGWGPNRNQSITETSGGKQSHKTGSASKIDQWFTPNTERLVEDFYRADYENPVFDFAITNLTQPTNPRKDEQLLLQPNDSIYKRGDWDGAPIVVAKRKLIFFTLPKVGATKWKQSFRRMEGYTDWKTVGGPKGLPHDPNQNGLSYLYDFSLEEANAMMTSPEWTKAIFVRSPKDRFLSVVSQMRNNPAEIDQRCCPYNPGCSSNLGNLVQFLELVQHCYSAHWAPYSERFDPKWWKHMTFIGHLEDGPIDARRLLETIGAWTSIGRTGWGKHGTEAIFVKDENAFHSVHKALGGYTQTADGLLNDYYKADYENPYLNFTSKKLYILDVKKEHTII